MSPLSPTLFAFTGLAILSYWWLGGHMRARLALLWAANCFFLARYALYLPLLLCAASSVDFALGAKLRSLDKERRALRRLLVTTSLVMNLGMLVATRLLPASHDPHWRWVFPLSLSFYCFQTLSYTLDAYRGDRQTTRSYLAHLAANTFFVCIVAGPINRLPELIAKLEAPFRLEKERLSRAILLIGSGLIKKLLIADFLADNLVNRVFDTPALYSGAEALIAAIGYSFQLYYDFSGYTDIALGLGELFGLQLPENFRRPYSSLNLREFWKRWHISFSEWIHDYIYNSLTKFLPNAKRWPVVVYCNLLITMLFSGLWHGSGLTFLIWGGLHGLGLGFTRFWYKHSKNRDEEPPRWWRWCSIGFTFLYVTLAWVFFRATDLQNALAVLGRIASCSWGVDNISAPLLRVLAVAVALHVLPERWFERGSELFARTPFYVQGAVMAGFVLLVQYLAGSSSAPFVYSHF